MWRFVSSSARWILCYFFVVVVVWLEVTAKWKGLVYNVFIFHLVSRCLRDADSHGWANGVHPRPRSISKAWNSIGLAVVALAAPALARPRQLARHSIASFVTLNRRCASFFPFFLVSLLPWKILPLFFLLLHLIATSNKLWRHLSLSPLNRTLEKSRRSRLLHVLQIEAIRKSLSWGSCSFSAFQVVPSLPGFTFWFKLSLFLSLRVCRRLKPVAVIGPNCQQLSALTRNWLRWPAAPKEIAGMAKNELGTSCF